MSNSNQLNSYWQSYLASLPQGVEHPAMPEAWHFCDNEQDANELAALVLAGVKQATASLYWGYEAEGATPPKEGDLSIIINYAGEPQCIIQSTIVRIVPYNQVSAEFAATEGEGDGSLAYWRRAHWDYFSRECAQIGKTPSEDMPVVTECFRVIYR
jgi:uncharacterized protein YhfF